MFLFSLLCKIAIMFLTRRLRYRIVMKRRVMMRQALLLKILNVSLHMEYYRV